MKEVRESLEEILSLADDTSYSHVARMIKIKGIATDALNLMTTPAKKGPGRPPKDADGGKAGNKIPKADKASPSPAAE